MLTKSLHATYWHLNAQKVGQLHAADEGAAQEEAGNATKTYFTEDEERGESKSLYYLFITGTTYPLDRPSQRLNWCDKPSMYQSENAHPDPQRRSCQLFPLAETKDAHR